MLRNVGSDEEPGAREARLIGLILRRKLLRWKLSDFVAAATSIVLAFVTYQQYRLSVRSAEDTAPIVDAAKKQAAAAQSFALSAEKINKGVYTAVDRLQELAQSTEQARKDTQVASSRTLQQSEDNFVKSQRPYVSVFVVGHPVTSGKRLQVDVQLSNYGITPALHVDNQGRIFIGEDAFKQRDAWFQNSADKPGSYKDIPEGVLMPIRASSSNTSMISPYFSRQPITSSELTLLKTKTFRMIVAGRISYSDYQKHNYYEDFCFADYHGSLVGCPPENSEFVTRQEH